MSGKENNNVEEPIHHLIRLMRKYFEKYPEDADKVILNIKGAHKAGTADPNGTAENGVDSDDN